MSELKSYDLVDIQDYRGEVYLKSEADKVIADLEESHKKEVGQLLMEIVELKDKVLQYKVLDKEHCRDLNTQEKFFAEKIRRLKRALYKACANWAHHRVFVRFKTNEEAWRNVERKCRAKAEEYK